MAKGSEGGTGRCEGVAIQSDTSAGNSQKCQGSSRCSTIAHRSNGISHRGNEGKDECKEAIARTTCCGQKGNRMETRQGNSSAGTAHG
eukprot:8916152-Karenia_brevis.AAC.1